MAHLYFTRHGQTVWNVENKICGATDIELTQLGHQQAVELGEKIKNQGIIIDEILYSPLSRAAETAKHISEVTGIPMREEMRLKEQNFGKYESTPRDGLEFKKAKENFISSFEGGETMLHLAARVYNLLDEIRNKSDKTYLLVAHNGISRIIQSYFYDMTNEEFAAFGIKNCEIREYKWGIYFHERQFGLWLQAIPVRFRYATSHWRLSPNKSKIKDSLLTVFILY